MHCILGRMDPVAHTLVGAAIAETGLARSTRYGRATLIIGANLPDVDVLSYLQGSDFALGFRRGWTHGLPAILILTLILWAGLRLLARDSPGHVPLNSRALFGLALLSVTSHPMLDWLNNYGMRWWMPFDGRWFYGDAVFIVDPWIWLMLGSALFLATSQRRTILWLWAPFALISSLAVWTLLPPSLWPAKLLWTVVLLTLIELKRGRRITSSHAMRRVAAAALFLTFVYIGSLLLSARLARSQVLADLAAEGIQVEKLMVGPVLANPFEREVVAATATSYRFGNFRWLDRPRLKLATRQIPRPVISGPVQEAYRSADVAGFLSWVRFPWAFVEKQQDGWQVYLLDARYTREPTRGFGGAVVEVPLSAQR